MAGLAVSAGEETQTRGARLFQPVANKEKSTEIRSSESFGTRRNLSRTMHAPYNATTWPVAVAAGGCISRVRWIGGPLDGYVDGLMDMDRDGLKDDERDFLPTASQYGYQLTGTA